MKRFNLSVWGVVMALVIATAFLNACTDEPFAGQSNVGNGETVVTLSLNVPEVATRALEKTDEDKIITVEVLAFKNNGTSSIYSYTAHGTVESDGKTAKVNLVKSKSSSDKYDLVILVNSKTEVDGAGITKDVDAKTVALGKVFKGLGTDKWKSTTSTHPGFPMSSDPELSTLINLEINESLSPATNRMVIPMYRSVARINVQLGIKDGKDACKNFKLTSVHVYNRNTSGYLTGKRNTSTPPVYTYAPNAYASKVKGPLVYSGTNEIATVVTDAGTAAELTVTSCVNEIYMFEVANPNPADPTDPADSGNVNRTDRPGIVVGGIYTNDKGDTDTDPTYYRLDFYKDDAYVDILRNHSYNFKITSVTGSGYEEPGEAFDAVAFNMEGDVLIWDDYDMNDIVFDRQNYLTVSPGEFFIGKEGPLSDQFTVMTDVSGGWEIIEVTDSEEPGKGNDVSISAANGWLTITSGSFTAIDTKDVVTFSVTPTTVDRTAYIHIKAGRLTYVVRVMQSKNYRLRITNAAGTDEITELVFAARAGFQPAAQTFKLNWWPAPFDVSFHKMDISRNTFVFDASAPNTSIAASGTIPGTGTISDIGTQSFTIQPTAIASTDDFSERTSVILYSVSNGTATVSKELILRQFVIDAAVKDFYLMDGARKSFEVRSNTPFTVAVKNNPGNVIAQLITTSVSNASASGTPVYFNIIDDRDTGELREKYITVTISSPNNLFVAFDVELYCIAGKLQELSNSYNIPTGGVAILIPVERCNESEELLEQLGCFDKFTSGLVWTDNSKLVADDSNIRMHRVAGIGHSGYVLVMPGSVAGNAVVDIKNLGGTRLWSWHIWVTNSDDTPAASGSAGFMDRNLGAISSIAGNDKSLGLLYQWGRKDPFPGSAAISKLEPTLYDANGSNIVGSGSSGAVANVLYAVSNFENSVRNPLTMYRVRGTDPDWYDLTLNSALWGSTKTVYDPCPPGWQVPSFERGTSWGGVSTGFTWDSTNKGYFSAAHGGFYPAAGYRVSNGYLGSVGGYGDYWSTSESPATAPAPYIGSYYLHSSSEAGYPPEQRSTFRATANSVRCQKIKI